MKCHSMPIWNVLMKKIILSVDENVNKLELSFTAAKNVKW